MDRIPVFISFHFKKDLDLKQGLIAQASLKESPFSIQDCSIERAIDTDWEKEAEARIAKAHLMLVICGADVHNSPGVTKEIQMAQRRNIPIHLLDPGSRPQSRPTGVPKDQERIPMDWKSLTAAIHPQVGRRPGSW